MKRNLFWIFTIVLVQFWTNCSTTFAQQDAQYSMYMFNGMVLNPAYAGSQGKASLTGLFREQWVGIEGAPSTQSLTFHTPFFDDKMGAGIWLVNDHLGISKYFHLSGAYAYRLPLKNGKLALGVQGGFSQYRADYGNVGHSFNPSIIDVAFDQNVNEILPNLGFGIYYQNDRFYGGLSVPQVFNNNLTDQITDARQSIHYLATGGYLINANKNISVTPSFMLKYVNGAPLSVDLNVLLDFYRKIQLGTSYRIGDSIDIIVAIPWIKDLLIAYAYDITLTPLGQYNSGSHELLLRFDFNFLGNNKSDKILTPRHF